MIDLEEAVEQLEQLVVDLSEELELRGETHGGRELLQAFGHIARAAELLEQLPDLSPRLSAEVRALQALCVCGDDRGEHLVGDGPCEACERCTAFRAADTEAPPPGSPTDIDELAGGAA